MPQKPTAAISSRLAKPASPAGRTSCPWKRSPAMACLNRDRKGSFSNPTVSPKYRGTAMAIFDGELGLQFVTHLANHYTVPDLVRLAKMAADKGFKQIWVNDNIRYRGQLVVLTAIAARVPIRLGTAIMVPYFHNPLDMADSFAALSELCGN